MKIQSISKVGKKQVYDISVADVEHYILENGVVTHNTGVVYSANQIFIIGRSQEKDGTEITGWNFTLNVEKSRFVKEKAKLPIKVSYEGGIDPYSGIMEWAIESGHIVKSGSRYQVVDVATGEIGEKKIWGKDLGPEQFDPILADPKFREFIKQKFMLTSRPVMDDIEVELEEEA